MAGARARRKRLGGRVAGHPAPTAMDTLLTIVSAACLWAAIVIMGLTAWVYLTGRR